MISMRRLLCEGLASKSAPACGCRRRRRFYDYDRFASEWETACGDVRFLPS
jgi:hypothetical protein